MPHDASWNACICARCILQLSLPLEPLLGALMHACLGRVHFYITHEMELSAVCSPLGLLILIDSCTRFAIETIRQQQRGLSDGITAFHVDALRFIPALASSLPQLMLTLSLVFVIVTKGDWDGSSHLISHPVITISIVCSTTSLLVAGFKCAATIGRLGGRGGGTHTRSIPCVAHARAPQSARIE